MAGFYQPVFPPAIDRCDPIHYFLGTVRGGGPDRDCRIFRVWPSQQVSFLKRYWGVYMHSSFLRRAIRGKARVMLCGVMAGSLSLVSPVHAADPLKSMLANGDHDALEQLLKQEPARAAQPLESGRTPLALAISEGDLNAVVMLVEAGAPVSLLDADGATPLQLSILADRAEMTDYLLKQGGDPLLKNARGQTALHWCAQAGNQSLCARLLKQGVSPLVQDERGQTPMDVAISWGRWSVLASLLDAVEEPASTKAATLTFDDDRLRYWSALYWAGRESELLASLEADLLSAAPQPYAAYIWSTVFQRQDRLEAAWQAASPSLQQALGRLPSMLIALDKDPVTAFSSYPAEAGYALSDLYGLIDLATEARDRREYPRFYDYLETAIRMAPDYWQLAWMFEHMPALEHPGMRERAQAFAASPEILGTLTGDYIRVLATQHRWRNSDRLAYVSRYLEANPQDARALVARSLALQGNAYYPEAVEDQMAGIARFPFYAGRTDSMAMFMQTGQPERAQRVAEGLSYWFGAENHDARATRYHVAALLDDGNPGAARPALETALSQFPEDGRLWMEQARLELKDQHPEQAIAAALKGWPLIDRPVESHLTHLLSGYRDSGDRRSAVQAFTQYRGQIALPSASMFDGVLGDLESLEDRAAYGQLLTEARALHPRDLSLRLREARWLWKEGRQRQAVSLLEEGLASDGDAQRLLDLLYDYTLEWKGETAARQVAMQAIMDRPWEKSAWTLAERSGVKTAPALWEEAVVKAATETFACEALISHYVDQKAWQEAHGWARDCLQRQQALGEQGRLSARQSLLLYDAWTYENQSRNQRVGRDEVVAAEASFDAFLTGRGHYMDYLRYREALCLARQDKVCAAQALAGRGEYQRDNTSHFHDLVARYSSELGASKTFGYGARMLARNPYDRQVVNSFLHKHLLWGGSPIVALKAINDANTRGMDVDVSWERKALGRLGDSLSEFEQYTVAGKRPGVSLRYVQWFESARRSALSADGTRVFYQLDGEMPGVEILLPSGEQVIRRDHPVFGKPVYFARGATFLKLDYTATGQLAAIEDSSGTGISLKYDDDDQISELNSPEGTLQFSYNDMGKPERIVEVGMGALDVSYDDNGEILSVDSDDGHQMALRITRSFQTLLGMVNQVKQIHDVKHLPQLSVDDPAVDALREEFENTEYLSADEQKAALALAEYLVAHVGDSPDYVGEAESLLYGAIAAARENDNKRFVQRGADAVTLLHRLYREVRPRGLPEYTFNDWSGAYGWLRSAELKKSTSKLRKTLAAIDDTPLTLLRDAHRLQRSDFSNTAYWKRYGNAQLFGDSLAGAEKHQVLLRENGDVVVATSKGLSVLSEGYWHWYGFDARTQRFSETVSPQALDERSQILALTETEDGVLWLGSARGLMAMAGEYEGDLKRWSVAQGLPSPRIESLAGREEQVWAGTAQGLVRLQYADSQPVTVPEAGSKAIEQLYRLPGVDEALLYRADNQIWLLAGGQTSSLGRGNDLAFEMERLRVYRLDNDQVFAHGLTDENGVWERLPGEAEIVAGRYDLLMSKRIHELSMWALEDGEEALVVNTDQGMNVLQGNYFEALALPFAEQRGGLQVGPRASWSDGRGVVLLSEDGVYTRLESDTQQMPGQRVYDLLVSEALDGVFVAMGDHILLLGNDLPLEAAQYFSSANARKLVADANGNLITHDGSTVLRFPVGSDQPQELFDADPGVEEDSWRGRIVDMLVDSRGTLWVVSGSSLFRYQGEQVTEFNYLIDSEQFPSRSPMLMGVHETLDGVIEVVASDEGHLFHEGVRLSGGLLRWNGKGFNNVGQPANWFVTGYTRLDDSTAVVATNRDFARELAGDNGWEQRQSFADLNDPSYLAVKEKNRLFWLGGDGSRFNNEHSWLFPSAGGVVLYHGGTWLYPDRLNQLLPSDQRLGQYGGRTVHAVAVAPNGRVYAGTDLGLLVYDAQGVASLLNDNQFGQIAFAEGDVRQQQAMSDIFLPSLSKDSEQGKLLQRYQTMQAQIRELEEKVNRGGELAVASAVAADRATGEAVAQRTASPEAERLRQQLESKNRLRETLLARMETEHFGLYQMLKLDPREVAAMHQRLGEEQALVQYLPTPEKLLIQLVTREGAQIREVDVSNADLELVSQLVVRGLRYRASHLGEGPDRGLSASRGDSAVPDSAKLDEHLAWLYDKLLRPVERELEGKQQVMVTPVGALTYLPFPALLREHQGERKEYAAERFNLGVIPSMYHLSLVLQQNASYSDGLTLVADPDGSLPGARQEVSRIAAEALVTPTVLEGSAATFGALSGAVREARVVHLATHGNLDPAVPADSYLLLANNYRLNVIDIAALKLDQTDLVVLSACETGIGKPGLEYATLARAFALASVPTVVASYWKVDDGATADLMEQFYGNLRDHPDGDYLLAMAEAQRALIRRGGRYADPAAWAAFTLFGKP